MPPISPTQHMRKKSVKKSTDEPVSLVQSVVDKLTKGIQEGRFVPGQRLVAADIAQEFEVSRSPVREAFHILAGQGIIELR